MIYYGHENDIGHTGCNVSAHQGAVGGRGPNRPLDHARPLFTVAGGFASRGASWLDSPQTDGKAIVVRKRQG